MRHIITTNRYDKSLKRCVKRGLDLRKLKPVIFAIASGNELPAKYRDHWLKGNYVGCRECHIEPDWLLIYRINNDTMELVDTGTHADLFG